MITSRLAVLFQRHPRPRPRLLIYVGRFLGSTWCGPYGHSCIFVSLLTLNNQLPCPSMSSYKHSSNLAMTHASSVHARDVLYTRSLILLCQQEGQDLLWTHDRSNMIYNGPVRCLQPFAKISGSSTHPSALNRPCTGRLGHSCQGASVQLKETKWNHSRSITLCGSADILIRHGEV